ncbi:hypothetical protein LTR08_007668 [Meristemomyces frigidus]|nr:hypothetical protein LTR08_007668 [Meristemomyces frigidus]
MQSTKQEAATEEPYIFTTLRWDPTLSDLAANSIAISARVCPFYMLEYHWARLQAASQTSSQKAASLADLFDCLSQEVQLWHIQHPDKEPEALRIKHRIYADGRTMTEITPTTRVALNTLFPETLDPSLPQPVSWAVTLDTTPTMPTACTSHKTSDRSHYDRARASADILSYTEAREVLLYNPRGEVLDGSITTPYFYRDRQWVTPAEACGGQQGTTRRWALDKGLCVEGVVRVSELRDSEVVWFSNGVRGFFQARVEGHGSDG